MIKDIRRFAVVAVVASVIGFFAPSPAYAAANLPYPSELGRWWLGSSYTGTGLQPMKNSSGQKIGEYELFVRHYHETEYSFELQVCVWDTLANGRGVIARVLLKYGTSSSYEVIKRKDGGGCTNTLYPSIGSPVWAVDVDHGETWSGTPYRYTGHFDRYAAYVNVNQRWPGFM
ncbi:hypothetical protein ACFT9M_15755 [Micromonospora purpureochromogenes]|uniref:hypothetical protein n=1 Tax=Micromonospora purpureochromogenes TaxID=47872 RepID=UPI00363AB551